MSEICLKNISLTVGEARLLKGVTSSFTAGELVALVGPNGAGKTSLLKCALGHLPLTSGSVTIDGADASALSPVERARQIAYLPQQRPLAWPVRVKDVVALGRYAYGASVTKLRGADAEAVAKAIADCDLSGFTERRMDSLSGGEVARAHCARAFAANAPLILADEPVAALDPSHQHKIMSFIRRHVDSGGGAVAVLHDISLAARYADRFVWMRDGEIVADGNVSSTLTADRMKEVFNVDATVSFVAGAPVVHVTGGEPPDDRPRQ